jgi:hypothetical protein
MKKYSFEYDDNKLKIKLFTILFLLFFVLFFGLMFFGINSFIIIISISLGIPIFTFWLNIKKIKKLGFVEIETEKIKFNLNDVEKEINFNEIKSFSINSYNGSSLSLKLTNDKKYQILSNSYFSNPVEFEKVCYAFETVFEKYNGKNNLESKREKSFFEKTWLYPFLVALTIMIVLIALYAIYKGVNFTAPFFGAIGTIFTLWSGYLNEKGKININKNSNK